MTKKEIPGLTKQQANELADLTRLALERTRTAVMSVGQLIENDALRGAMLTAVAVDLLRGAASLIADASGKSEREAMGVVLREIVEKIHEDQKQQRAAR